MDIIPIPAFNDNYIWTLIDKKHNTAIVVDPGDAKPVIAVLERQGIDLIGILITHHHYDHAGGIHALTAWKNVPVYGPPHENIAGITDKAIANREITFPSHAIKLKTFAVPGHTQGHIVYYDDQHLFCGDTLFSAGCGRVFEGTFREMYESLQKLKSLPAHTKVYCAHEYTQKNLQFAEMVEPENKAIKERIATVNDLLRSKHNSLPSTLAIEKQTNPFLRCDQSTVLASAEKKSGKKLVDEIAVFTVLRKWKDGF